MPCLPTTQDAIDRAARRLMEVRRRPHRALATAMQRLIERRYEDPLAGLPIVTAREISLLSGEENGRQPHLADLTPGGSDEYDRAMARLAASALRQS